MVAMATAALDILLTRLLRLRRSATLVAGVAAYAIAVWLIDRAGMVRVDGEVFVVAIGVAAAGLALVPVALAVDGGQRAEPFRLRVAAALWAHVALVTTAVMATTPLRLLLLASTLLGLTFTALHVRRQQLAHVALSTWIAYVLCMASLVARGILTDPLDAGMNVVGYSLALVGGWLVAREVARLRDELSGRTEALEAALAKVRELAMRDDLTGLYNRRHLLDYLQRQKALADRDTLTFAVCYVDLDHFKRVNDRFGHQQGDDVLKAFADVARRVVREEDFVARMGGEEFVLVLINATVSDAVRVADRLRRQTQLMMVHPDAPEFTVTASVGIAAYRKREPIEQLLNRADAAMYAAKSQGRNRVVVAPGIETDAMPGAAAR